MRKKTGVGGRKKRPLFTRTPSLALKGHPFVLGKEVISFRENLLKKFVAFVLKGDQMNEPLD